MKDTVDTICCIWGGANRIQQYLHTTSIKTLKIAYPEKSRKQKKEDKDKKKKKKR